MPRAIFFDLDETLIRHAAPVMDQLQTACRQHLADLPAPRLTIFQEYLLAGVEQIWNNIAAHQGRCEAAFTAVFRGGLESAGCATTLAEPMIEAFLALVVDSAAPAAGAHEVLDRLADAGIATAIITNGFSFLQQRKAQAHGLTERVRTVVTSEDAGAHKPDARIFRLAMARVGVAAADCWHVGDSHDKDIAGALGAGMGAVLYEPERQLEALYPAPHRVIRRLTEIPELLLR